MQPAFRLNAPQTDDDDGDVENSSSNPFGTIGERVENPTSGEFHLHNNRLNNSIGMLTSSTANTNGVVSLASLMQSSNRAAAAVTNSTTNGSEDAALDPEKVKKDNQSGENTGSSGASTKSYKWLLGIGIVTILMLVVVIIAVSIVVTNNKSKSSNADGSTGTDETTVDGTVDVSSPEDGSSPPTNSTLDPMGPPLDTALGRIYNEGILKCGVAEDQPGFAFISVDTGRMHGFDADLCRAVAAAIFGPDNLEYRMEFYPVSSFDRFQQLKDGVFDVMARVTTHTMEREVMEAGTGSGFDFSIPYLYNGVQFAGVPRNAACADNLTVTGEDCNDTKICVEDGTTHVDVVLKLMPDATIVLSNSPELMYTNFISGFCNVITGEQFDIAESLLRQRGYTGDYGFGTLVHSKEPLAMVTRDDDAQFSDFVNWVMEALISAEEAQIVQENAGVLPSTTVFGPAFQAMFINVIAAVGNYGEIYERHLETLLSRPVADTINEGNSGLIYALPFGDISAQGDGPVPSGTIEKILERGYLRCGISTRVIFAQFNETTEEWNGFDVDFCKALSAALFDGVTDTVEYTDLSASDRFVALDKGDVDVLSRLTTVTLSRDVQEADTGVGFSFARPNFFDGMTFGGVPPYGACADDLVIIGASCEDIKICVNAGTTFDRIVKELFPERVIVSREDGDAIEGLADGVCNAIAGGVVDVSSTSVRNSGYDGPYQTGFGRYSKDPLALVTRQTDVQWSRFVFWIVEAIFYAEETGITMETANQMPKVNILGSQFQDAFGNAIAAVGNYGEIYARSAEAEVPRGGLNLLNEFLETPQFYPLPGVL